VPAVDYFDGLSLNDPDDLNEGLSCLISDLQRGHFLCWDAVVRQEQGLPLTPQQQEALSGLIDFGEEENDRILYIDDMPRPDKPWYEIVRQMAGHLAEGTSRQQAPAEVIENWPKLVVCLESNCEGMTLPPGVDSPLAVIPRKNRLDLWLRYCFGTLSGIEEGSDEYTLASQSQHWRIDVLIDRLKECRKRLRPLNLTPQRLALQTGLPPREQKVLAALLAERLGMGSASAKMETYLAFRLGESVRVKPGVQHPDGRTPVSGWQGRVSDVAEGDGQELLIGFELDRQTLRGLPDEYIRESEMEGLDWATLYLSEEELEPAEPRDTEEEAKEAAREREAPYAFVGLGEEGPRIQAVLNGIDPLDYLGCARAWARHLQETLAFPFEAVVDEMLDSSPLDWGDRVQVHRISDSDDHYGVIVEVTRDGERLDTPLCDLEVTPKGSPNYQPVSDYRVWFGNR